MANLTPLFLNGVYSTVQAGSSAIGSASATGIDVASGDGAAFGAIGTSQYIPAVIVDTSTSPETIKEYVWITARSTDALTVVRQAEDSARFPASTSTIQAGYVIAAVASADALRKAVDIEPGAAVLMETATPYYGLPGAIPVATITTLVLSGGTTIFAPMLLTQDSLVTKLGVNVTAAVASSTAKIVIYAADSTWAAGAAVYTSASIDTSTTGIKTIDLSGSPVTLPRGRYWLALWPSAAITVRVYPMSASAFGTYDMGSAFPQQFWGTGTDYPAAGGPLDPAGTIGMRASSSSPGIRTPALMVWQPAA